MKRSIIVTLLIAVSFSFGFGLKSITSKINTEMKKVTGIGGVFFKCKDPKAIN